jgi:hypothetical protein
MSDCCSGNANSGRAPAVMACPANGARSKRVDALTVKSLVRKLPLGMPNTQYYFCDAPDCELVYFALDTEAPRFRREDLVVRVGAKRDGRPDSDLLLLRFHPSRHSGRNRGHGKINCGRAD